MDDVYQNGVSSSYGGVHHRQPYEQANGFQASQYQESPHDGTQTLPPIQAQRPMLQHASHSYDQYRPHGLSYSTSSAPYQSYYGQSMSQAPYPQNGPQYSTNSSYARQSSQPGVSFDYASASGQSGLPVLRPMPAAGFDTESRAPLNSVQDILGAGRSNQPRPVVGSQGRRGILPSDEGRPPVAAVEGDPASKANFNPAKGADGKYACPHCPKTYLHAKHLKRHHLRRRRMYPEGFYSTDILQTPEIDLIRASCVARHSHEVIFSKGISKNVPYGGATRRVLPNCQTRSLISRSRTRGNRIVHQAQARPSLS